MATDKFIDVMLHLYHIPMKPNRTRILGAMMTMTPRGSTVCAFSREEIANRAHVGLSAVKDALKAFEKAGIVESMGSGPNRPRRINEDAILAIPRKPLLSVEKQPVGKQPVENQPASGLKIDRSSVENQPVSGRKTTDRAAQPAEVKRDFPACNSNSNGISNSDSNSTPPISPPLGFWAAKAKAAREERESQVLNGKGSAESVSAPAPIEAPRPERRPTPKQAIQDQPEQLMLTCPVEKPESAKKAPKFALKMPTEVTPRNAVEKAEIEAIARVYAHYVERMSSPGMMARSEERRKREEAIRWWLRHPELSEADLIDAIDGCIDDDWWNGETSQTDLVKDILKDPARIRMFIGRKKKALTRSVRPTEYRNKRPNREQMLHHARLVASGTSSKHTLEGMCRYYSISEEDAQMMIDEAQAKYSHLPNYGLPTHAGWGQ